VRDAAFFLVWASAAAAAIVVFFHATRHGNRHATAWGISVFCLGLGLPFYVVHLRRTKPGGKRRY
jgi:hypothetical protein